MFCDPEVTFAAAGLDRAAHLRSDSQVLAGLWASPAALCLALWRGKVLMGIDGARLLPCDHRVFAGAATTIFLGLVGGNPVFAADLSAWEPPAEAAADTQGFLDQTVQRHPLLDASDGFADLRGVMGQLTPLEGELLASARALIAWHQGHGFCARCGAASEVNMGGWQRRCRSCKADHFPRTDPVVIMLVTRGNSVLVGRGAGWPEGMYSLLAGFMEPGETIEAAVRREVQEEAGVPVGRVDYLASQPWPFPASLMIGCRGEALASTLTIDPAEIEDALWLTREDLARVFAGEHPVVRAPRKGAIAAYLMQEWLADRLGSRQ